MMKSFFKKLAFVMALAMVVSMVAPAATTAVAAEDKALAIAYQKGAAITALNLTEVGATEDLRFVYAPENWKDLDVKWSSSNENVVSVDANGVVKAEAAGVATISVAVGTETASIDVYSVDMTTFTATMGTAENREITELTLKVGDEFDFAFYGIKDYSVDRYKCEWWPVDPEGVITCDEKGLVTAVKAGTAKLTLAVYNLATGMKTDVSACVITVEDETPAIDNSFTVKQLNSDTVEVTFAKKDITDKEISFKATSEFGDVKNEDEYISVSAVKDGVVTVKFYNGLVSGYKYTLTNNGETTEFTVSNGVVDRIVISYNCCNTPNVAYAGQTVNLSAKVYSGDVEVTANNGITFKYVSSVFGSESVGTSFYGVQAGEVVTVTAMYYNTGATDPVVATIAIPVQATPEYKMKTSNAAMGIAYAANVSYEDWMGNTISTSDLGKYMVFKTEDILGNTVWGNTGSVASLSFYSNQYGVFRFTTTNDTVLGVSESNGALYPRSAGTALIQVWFVNSATGTKSLVGTKQVTVYGPRVLNTFTLSKTSSNNMTSSAASTYASVANVAGADSYNQVTYQFSTKDQLGDKMTADLWATFNNADDNGAVTVTTNNGTNGTAKFIITANDVFGADVTKAYKDVELTLHAKNSVEMTQQVVVRIFNVNYQYKNTTQQAFVHTDSTGDLGVIANKTGVRYLYAGVVDFENNAYHTSDNLQGVIGAWDVPTSVRNIVNNANIAKANIANAQNVATPAQEAAIASAAALVADGGWYYEVIVDGWNDVSGAATIVNKNTTNEVLQYQVRDAAANLKSHYDTDLSKNLAHTYDADGNITACPDDCARVDGDVFDNTRWGQTVAFTFYKVVYNQYTSRFEYVTKTVTKSLANGDRAVVGGTAEVMTNRAPGAGIGSVEQFVQNYIHVTVYDKDLDKTITLCDKADCWKTKWGIGDGAHFSLAGVVTNGEGVYTGNIYVDSQTVNNWAYIVSILVTYNNGDGEVVTVEIPVNTRVEW